MSMITIQALGRPCYLGQLYNATSTNLIPGFRLFNTSEVRPIRTTVSSTDIKYEEVRGLKEKAESLNISAQLSVSILSGAIDVSGMGSYLKSDKESSDSITVVTVGRYRTYNESLDVNQLLQSQAMTGQQLATMGATHVVTSITYGGNVVGSLTQKQDLSTSDLDVKGKFSLEIFKGIGKLFGISGCAELSADERERINSYGLEVKLTADFFSEGDQIPCDVSALFETFKKSPSLIGQGIACEVILTPLAWFHTGLPTFRELADADILELAELYDNILLLGQHRSALSASAYEENDLFPSFVTSCRKSSLKVNCLVGQARQELRLYLETYRLAHADVKAPIKFRDEVDARFNEERRQYEKDHDQWRSIMEHVRAAKKHGFPPASVREIKSVLARQTKGAIAVILVPENVRFSKLLSTYCELAADIRRWRTAIDNEPADDGTNYENSTAYYSIYADERVDCEMVGLDDESSSVEQALRTAREEKSPVFLSFGLNHDIAAKLGWRVLNQEGWGVLVNQEEGWRYVGDVRKGVRHGVGVVTYTDGSVYQGDWFDGKRDESGELIPPQSQSIGDKPIGGKKGVFIDNIYAYDGLIVKVTVYRGGSPIQFSRVALRKGDATITHVDKIGRVLRWQLGKRYRLRVESDRHAFTAFEILVNGTQLDPSEDPDVEKTAWPLDADGEKLITVNVL